MARSYYGPPLYSSILAPKNIGNSSLAHRHDLQAVDGDLQSPVAGHAGSFQRALPRVLAGAADQGRRETPQRKHLATAANDKTSIATTKQQKRRTTPWSIFPARVPKSEGPPITGPDLQASHKTASIRYLQRDQTNYVIPRHTRTLASPVIGNAIARRMSSCFTSQSSSACRLLPSSTPTNFYPHEWLTSHMRFCLILTGLTP